MTLSKQPFLILLGCLLQIQNVIPSRRIVRSESKLEVTVGVDKIGLNDVTYSCNSTSGSGSENSGNFQGQWSIICTGDKQETVLATFGGSPGFQKKHEKVTGGSSRTTFNINLSQVGQDSGRSSGNTESNKGPSSTLVLKPICEGNITCKIGTGSHYENAETDMVKTMGPLVTKHTRNFTSTGQTDTVTASCQPKTMCGSFNVTWFNSSTASSLGTGTFGTDTTNTTKATNSALKWVDGSVQLSGSLWAEFDREFCLSCEVRTCGLVGMTLVCDDGSRHAFRSASPGISVPSWYQTLFVTLLVLLMTY
ncbi:m160 [Muromegalovirus C4A]|uniref:M160 n=1 Tax=Muromegalovirus C4A TaxID=524649 RepID=B3UY87_MUHV1|nr:m160 [Muromegalovirus C4A]